MPRIVELPPDVPPLDAGVVAGGWWRETGEAPGQLLCELCPRACKLKPGDRGFCFVRENRGGQMALTTYGRSTGFCIDPIEKKPLNHFYPGTSVLSFGTAGCNLGCRFCQNWDISKSREVERLSEQATPEAIARAASQLGCRSVAFTYNDPVIWAEYAIDVAAACRAEGINSVAVTAGYIMPQAREPFFSAMDAANVDLKGFSEAFYHQLTASHLQPVLDTLVWLRHESDVWFEITNLIIPQANDSEDELKRMCDWIVEQLGDQVPVHFTAFHPDFRMRDRGPTPHETLLLARELAVERGIRYAYVGNVDDVRHQSTYCGGCGGLLIERNWYDLGAYHVRLSPDGQGRCGHCGGEVAGRFDASPGKWGRRREPVAMRRFAEPLVAIGEPRGSQSEQPTGSATDRTASESDSSNRSGIVSSTPSSTVDLALSEPQQAAVRRACLQIMEAVIRGSAPQLDDPTLAGASRRVVQGIFTTIKRGGHLRGCCGTLGKPMPLLDALRHAATRTAVDDNRMPPLTIRELPLLDLEVSILHSFESLEDPQRRLGEVEIGKHGLQIRRGDRAGLLLPVVAEERQWDAEAFLRAVCGKAGLPSNAWQDAGAELIRFQAAVCSGPLLASDDTPPAPSQPLLSGDELQRLREHVEGNIRAHMTGATPSYYLQGCSDGTVQGVALIVESESLEAPLRLTQLSMRPGLPLQTTLFSLTENAARQLVSRAADPAQLTADVIVFNEVALHGRLSDVDLRGVEPASHAVLVSERGKIGWSLDPDAAAEELVAEAARQAQCHSPAAAQVFSLGACSSVGVASGSTAPQPVPLQGPRPPAVAGAFYPGDPAEMRKMLDNLFGDSVATESCRAVMLPHAGWQYSGHVAAKVLERVDLPATAIVIGPKHTRDGVEWAVCPHREWRIPGGTVASSPELAEKLAETIEGLQLDAAAHLKEHGVEVELPLLARRRPDIQVVGIVLAGNDWEQARQFAAGLSQVIRSLDEPPLLVISSDMNHFATDQENRRLDELALQAMESGDGGRLLATCGEHAISMCGAFPAAVVMETLRQLGQAPAPKRVAYATSADATGDKSRVVGYAGMLIP